MRQHIKNEYEEVENIENQDISKSNDNSDMSKYQSNAACGNIFYTSVVPPPDLTIQKTIFN